MLIRYVEHENLTFSCCNFNKELLREFVSEIHEVKGKEKERRETKE